jgi:hypothetical protein
MYWYRLQTKWDYKNISEDELCNAPKCSTRSNTWILGLNPIRGLDVCPSFFCVCIPGSVEGLIPPSDIIIFIIAILILNGNRQKEPNLSKRKKQYFSSHVFQVPSLLHSYPPAAVLASTHWRHLFSHHRGK